MSRNYDNWERLVDAVLRREKDWQIAHDHSRSPSSSSLSSDSSLPTDHGPVNIWRAEPYLYEQNPTAFSKDVITKGVFKKTTVPELVFLRGCSPSFVLGDIFRSSAQVLGKGTFGTSYSVTLDNGNKVVVKKLKDVILSKREFEQQLEIFGSIRHENVVVPIAYYFSRDAFMIYDYQSQGSLSALLHGNTVENQPDWETRLRIAKGTARGIAHIHTRHRGRLVHGNIKASNIFLNSQKYGCVSDFGLGSAEVVPVVMCTTGYRAPEVTIAGKVSQASDVYSFGVLLLELLTGKSPMNAIGVKKVDLVKWVLFLLGKDRRLEVFKGLALRFPNEVEEMGKMLRVAMSCVADSPHHRPKMPDVLKMVEDL
ncbi:unnamed protein product [Fraxinus pennsylvanica]|uniref:Protein kinase domain-containing protein n=1 Tax=Fraxinus pennsylvanica TaxID=56036 RepID=A0AAD1ZXV2_9LAMI|nr:unnamed protein product [Fraxinus pennsylvanica]